MGHMAVLPISLQFGLHFPSHLLLYMAPPMTPYWWQGAQASLLLTPAKWQEELGGNPFSCGICVPPHDTAARGCLLTFKRGSSLTRVLC